MSVDSLKFLMEFPSNLVQNLMISRRKYKKKNIFRVHYEGWILIRLMPVYRFYMGMGMTLS